MAVRIGRWDCSTCGTKGILGPKTRCDNCGATRPKGVKFYLPKDAEIVQDESRIQEARAGVDWICGHCDGQNKAKDTHCLSCGNIRDKSSQDIDLQEREYSTGEVPQESFERERTKHPLEGKTSKRKSGGVFKKIVLAGLLLVAGFIFLRIFPQQIEVTVDQFEWKRTVQMLHHEPVVRESWDLPKGAFETTSFQDVHHYDQVFRGYETRTRSVQVKVGEEQYVCGQIDKGNGYFVDKYCSRPIYENRQEEYQEEVYDQVPVYATKYRYRIMEWVPKERYLLRKEAKDHSPLWPEMSKQPDPQNWKAGKKTEEYYVYVKEPDGDLHQEQVGMKFWTNLTKGQTLQAERSYLFDIYYGITEPTKAK